MKNLAGKAASIFGFLAVALGAFAAHGLKKQLSPEMLLVFETGVRYQMFHALALFALAVKFEALGSCIRRAVIFFIAGIFLFSGSLYVLALSGIKAWGMVTPFGGLLFLAGWAALGVQAFSKKENQRA